MECPKCGFQQPEELYCAQCGIHIPSALKRKKRRTQAALAGTALVFVLLGAAGSIWWFKYRSGPEAESPVGTEERQSIPRIQPPPPLPGPSARSQREPSPTPSRKSAPAPKKGKSDEKIEPPEKDLKLSPSSQPPSAQPVEPDPEVQLKRWAAQEWVDRGKELGDDPEQEMEMYRKALEVNPGYPPAHYHLGMLHWRRSERDMALEEFRKFWKEASPEERRSLLVPEEIAPEELGLSPGE